jgi:hypothetical protein
MTGRGMMRRSITLLETLGEAELTDFGLFAATAMLVCYALEDRSHWFILTFARSRALGSLYGFSSACGLFG